MKRYVETSILLDIMDRAARDVSIDGMTDIDGCLDIMEMAMREAVHNAPSADVVERVSVQSIMNFAEYKDIVNCLPRFPSCSKHGFWVNADGEVMCSTKEQADIIADFFEELGYEDIHTHNYDDKDYDGNYYGYWAVYPD